MLDSASKGSAELWLAAAYDSLIESGIDGVRIMPLAKQLGLSRTSFYWFFKDREALLDALLKLWRDRNTGGIARQASAYAETAAEAVLNVMDCWFDDRLFDARFEFAVRSWALQSPEISTEILNVDAFRLDVLTRMFIRHGFDAVDADVRARTVYLTQIGYISMQTQEELDVRMSRLPTYIAIFTGKTPTESEMRRFFARHGYPSKQAAIRPSISA